MARAKARCMSRTQKPYSKTTLLEIAPPRGAICPCLEGQVPLQEGAIWSRVSASPGRGQCPWSGNCPSRKENSSNFMPQKGNAFSGEIEGRSTNIPNSISHSLATNLPLQEGQKPLQEGQNPTSNLEGQLPLQEGQTPYSKVSLL